MFYITRDIHGSIDIEKLSGKNFPEGKKMTREDYLIICGDFGLPFLLSNTYAENEFIPNKHARSARNQYRYWIDWLSERPYSVLWIDGNHDNHPYWNAQPTVDWNGGKVNFHPDAKNTIHLRRGEYYDINGTTFWTMGGAESYDKDYRVNGFTWWKEEIPSFEEMQHGLNTLQEHNNRVDYILTHTIPQQLIAPTMQVNYDSEPTRSYLDKIYNETEFKYWFCGHFHIDLDCPEYKLQILFNNIKKIGVN
ncbi:MAG: metallophosphoesterase [Clostridiales bacterium]|nr:metallophosphoesterase [Clostridiales bacterium]